MKPSNYPQNPKDLWNIFYDFTQTPRPSKFEDKIRNYLVNLAKKENLKHVVDKVGNVIIYVPGTQGKENESAVIIQNHIDMVTDALPGKKINFKEDALELQVEGDWLKAVGTTLGSDNGIGCAAALATIYDKSFAHPPLELLFTVDEETGLNGALGLESHYLSGRKMLNLDTEEWGSLYIGCAGGIDYDFNREFSLINSDFDSRVKITISDLIGGHSGVDIHEQRGNANKLLVHFLAFLGDQMTFAIEEFRGGKAHNIIPRDAFVILHLNKNDHPKLQELIKELLPQWRGFLPKNDQKVQLQFEILERGNQLVLSQKDQKSLLNFLVLFPHGAHTYDLASSRQIVSMSNNLARVLLVEGRLYCQSSLRFFDRQEIKMLENQMVALAALIEAQVSRNSEYPSWKPIRESQILSLVQETYQDLFAKTAKVTAIHAGLECGILRDKIGPIDVVSFGPTITGAHSPDERVQISTVENFWRLFKAVLERI
jgi:dipeptidase D